MTVGSITACPLWQTIPPHLFSVLQQIRPLDETAMTGARERCDQLTKPPGSLGRLEQLAIHIAGIRAEVRPTVSQCAVLLFAGDHGVAHEGVSAYPQAVTQQMIHNMCSGGAAINVLAKTVGATVTVVDVGVATPVPDHPFVIQANVVRGTRSIIQEPAMTMEQLWQAIDVGLNSVQRCAKQGVTLLACGEMGIANTTIAATMTCALFGIDATHIVGTGTGIDSERLEHKRRIVTQAIAYHRPFTSALDVLQRVGGAEIAALVGCCIGAARWRIPLVLDGFMTTVAASVACHLEPMIRDFVIASHQSTEPGHAHLLDALHLRPLIDWQLRLGEASGALLMLPTIVAATRLLNEMATFTEAKVEGRNTKAGAS